MGITNFEPTLKGKNVEVLADEKSLDLLPYGRYNTLTVTLNLIRKGCLIVEIGSARHKATKLGDGWATLAFAQHCQYHMGTLITIDKNKEAIRFSAELTSPYHKWVEFVHADAFDFFQSFRTDSYGPYEKIGLLYLDAWAGESDRYVELWRLIESKCPVEYVLIDDIHRPNYVFSGTQGRDVKDDSTEVRGKAVTLLPILTGQGYEVEFFEQSQLLLRNPSASGLI